MSKEQLKFNAKIDIENMAKNDFITNTLDPLTFAGGQDPLMRKYLELQVKQLEREEAELLNARQKEELDKKIKEERRAIETERIRAEKEAIVLNQTHCPHKTGMSTLVRGQSLGSGRMKFICQFCLKEYDSWAEIPPHLHPPVEQVGGPKNF